MRPGRKTPSDAALVERALAGSPDAFRELVERYQRPVLSVVLRLVGDPAVAEDLAQEVFLKAFRNLHTFDRRRKLSSWLFKIAHNATIDQLRRKTPETMPLEATAADGEESWEVLPAPEEESPERRAEHAQLVRGLEAALGRLSPRYREILLLRFQQGLAYHEIAEVTGLAMGTVKVQLHRARRRLADELAAAGFEPPGHWRRPDRTADEEKPGGT